LAAGASFNAEEIFSHCPTALSFFLVPITSGCRGVLEWSETLSESAFATESRAFRRSQVFEQTDFSDQGDQEPML
jgi:hypothetical protein